MKGINTDFPAHERKQHRILDRVSSRWPDNVFIRVDAFPPCAHHRSYISSFDECSGDSLPA